MVYLMNFRFTKNHEHLVIQYSYNMHNIEQNNMEILLLMISFISNA